MSGNPTGRGPMIPESYRVVATATETDDTVTITLSPESQAIRPPGPGQFNMLAGFGNSEVPISLATLNGDLLLHTVRRVGAATTALCELEIGDWVGVRGPYGVGWDRTDAIGRDILIIVGGLGLAPVRLLIEQILENRADYGRVAVLIGARSPDDLIYRDLLERWSARTDLDLHLTVDAAPTSWRGDVGLVTELIPKANIDITTAVTTICGPEIMMRFSAQRVIELGGRPADTHLSLERNMHCAIGHCGHCQLGPAFICKDGPVLDWLTVEPLWAVAGR